MKVPKKKRLFEWKEKHFWSRRDRSFSFFPFPSITYILEVCASRFYLLFVGNEKNCLMQKPRDNQVHGSVEAKISENVAFVLLFCSFFFVRISSFVSGVFVGNSFPFLFPVRGKCSFQSEGVENKGIVRKGKVTVVFSFYFCLPFAISKAFFYLPKAFFPGEVFLFFVSLTGCTSNRLPSGVDDDHLRRRWNADERCTSTGSWNGRDRLKTPYVILARPFPTLWLCLRVQLSW